jgi:hypothetical protein
MKPVSQLDRFDNAEIETYLRSLGQKSLLRFLTCGSVDDGKSTLIGRLLYESKMIFEDQLAAFATAITSSILRSRCHGTKVQRCLNTSRTCRLARTSHRDRFACGAMGESVGPRFPRLCGCHCQRRPASGRRGECPAFRPSQPHCPDLVAEQESAVVGSYRPPGF